MRQFADVIRIQTNGQGLVDMTPDVAAWVGRNRVDMGLLTLFCRHTSASLLIQENAAPEVRIDLEAFFRRIAPEEADRYAHADEGPDDMPAHIRAALTGVHLSIPVVGGKPALGVWQGVYLFAHRRAPPLREIAAHLIGD